MAVWNLGSINIDRFYQVPHFPAAGETLATQSFSEGLGGKGANMSVAIARAAARVHHIGAIGQDGLWTRDRLTEYGVDTRFIKTTAGATGHANIAIDAEGENNIILYAGANAEISDKEIGTALTTANANDILITQNETSGQVSAARLARQMGLNVAYAAAPFSAEAVKSVLEFTDILILNEVEAQQLSDATGKSPKTLGVPHVIVTLGGEGAVWYDAMDGSESNVAAHAADVVDTTGAGDTFTGFLIAGLDRGLPMAQSLDLASKAGSIMVSRRGTADVIPDLKDIEDRFSGVSYR